jgi:hypothetical protein
MSYHCLKNAMIGGVFRKKITSQLNSGYATGTSGTGRDTRPGACATAMSTCQEGQCSIDGATQREGVTSKDEVPVCARIDHCSLLDEHLTVLVHSRFQLWGNDEVGVLDMIEGVVPEIAFVRVQDDFTVSHVAPEALR